MPDVLFVPGTSIITFGDLLRHLRQRAGLTQQEFGLAVGYSHAQIARLEGGKRLPDVAAVRALFIAALGLQPDSESATRLIELAVVARSSDSAHTEPAAEDAWKQIPNNLPVQLTNFVGRAQEVPEVQGLVGEHHLVTLTGSGGVGKTRLALEVAAALLTDRTLVEDVWADGVWLVELAPLADPALVPRAVAAALGVYEEHNRPLQDTLTDYLRTKRLLLILDNCEHVIDACARLVEALLRQCCYVRVLASSREAMGVSGELAWRVPSLPQAEAVQLFVERAALVLPSFALTDTSTPAVQQVCARLDGIPLAIELAAARVKVLSPERIAERLGDRFRLLTGGSRTALPRQQTLRGAIDWSYNLLSETERALLRRLSVFVGGWTLEAAEAVCAGDGIEPGDILDLLTHLVDKSLVMMVAGESGGIERYRMLETICQYARERLADTEEGASLRDRHLDYFAKLGQAVGPQLGGAVYSDQVNLMKRLAPDLDNVRSALEWTLETGRADEGLEMLSFDAYFWMWFQLAAQSEMLAWNLRLLAQRSSEKWTLAQGAGFHRIAWLYDKLGEWDQATPAAEQALSIGVELDDLKLQFAACTALAFINMDRGHLPQARSYAQKVRDLAIGAVFTGTVFGEKSRAVVMAEVEGFLAFHEGDYKQAQTVWAQLYELAAERNDTRVTSAAARWLGYALLYQNAVVQAVPWLRESLVENAALGDKQAVAASLAAFAAYALARGELRLSARLFGSSEALCEVIRTPLNWWDVVQVRRNTATLRNQLDETALDAAWTDGRAMTLDEAVAYALSDDDK